MDELSDLLERLTNIDTFVGEEVEEVGVGDVLGSLRLKHLSLRVPVEFV